MDSDRQDPRYREAENPEGNDRQAHRGHGISRSSQGATHHHLNAEEPEGRAHDADEMGPDLHNLRLIRDEGPNHRYRDQEEEASSGGKRQEACGHCHPRRNGRAVVLPGPHVLTHNSRRGQGETHSGDDNKRENPSADAIRGNHGRSESRNEEHHDRDAEGPCRLLNRGGNPQPEDLQQDGPGRPEVPYS